MDALAKLIAKKKKDGEGGSSKAQRWKRKADIESERKRQYLEEEAKYEEEQKAKRLKLQQERDALNAPVPTTDEQKSDEKSNEVAEVAASEVQATESNTEVKEVKETGDTGKPESKAEPEAEEEEEAASVEVGPPNETDYCKEDYVSACIRHYLSLWRQEVAAMDAEARSTREGRVAVTASKQTVQWLKPLQRLLRRRQLKKEVLDGLHNIFAALHRRDFVGANRIYLEQLAIGNAPWPMGATMVGIHARAAREKIAEDKIAHVMNDEQTRKYIQCVKRLITVAERHYSPPTLA